MRSRRGFTLIEALIAMLGLLGLVSLAEPLLGEAPKAPAHAQQAPQRGR